MITTDYSSVFRLSQILLLVLLCFGCALDGRSQDQTRTGVGIPATRTWTDSTGKFKIEAQLLSIADDLVRLRKADGKEISLPADRLSPVDLAFIQSEMVKSLDQKIVNVALSANHDVTKKVSYRPKSLALTEEKPSSLKSLPDNLSKSPLFGEIPLGDADNTVLVVLDTTSDSKLILIVDQNNDKDLTNDTVVEDISERPGEWKGYALIDVRYHSGTQPVSMTFYRTKRSTPRSLAYYPNTKRVGLLKLGIEEYSVSVSEMSTTANFSTGSLAIDFFGKGKLVAVEPKEFVIGDLSCELVELSPDGTSMKIRCQSIANERRLNIELEPVHVINDFIRTYSPSVIELSKERPFALKAEPKYLSSEPLYGSIALGDAETQVCVVVDEPADATPRIFVDTNGDTDLTNDGDGAWSEKNGPRVELNGRIFHVNYKDSQEPYSLRFYRLLGKSDRLNYYRDTLRKGKVRIAGKEYRLAIYNDNNDGRFDDLSRCHVILDLRNSTNEPEPLAVKSSEWTLHASQSMRLGNSTAKVHSVSADGRRLTLRAPSKKINFDGRLALVGEQVPDLKLKSLNGEPYVLQSQPEDYDYTLLHIWDSRTECLEHLPEIARIANRYRNSRVRMVGIYLGADRNLAEEATRAWSLDFTQLWDERGSESPLMSLFYNSYGLAAPRVVILNASNLVVEANANDPWSLEKRVTTFLGKGDAAVLVEEPQKPVPVSVPSRPMEFAIPESVDQLTHLSLYGQRGITDDDIKKLAQAKQLTWIELYGTSVTDEGLEHLAALTQLESLFLGETGISDAGLAKLSPLTQLKCLNIQKNPKITDAGLATLRGMKDLEVINLYGAHVTDTGLQQLEVLTKLRHLNVTATLVGPMGQQAIRDVVPDCSFTKYPDEWLPSFGQKSPNREL